MNRNILVSVVISLLVAGCGMSKAEKKELAAITCSIMIETRNMDSAVRVEKINDARREMGEDPYLAGDRGIMQAFEYRLCDELVMNDPTYEQQLCEKKTPGLCVCPKTEKQWVDWETRWATLNRDERDYYRDCVAEKYAPPRVMAEKFEDLPPPRNELL